MFIVWNPDCPNPSQLGQLRLASNRREHGHQLTCGDQNLKHLTQGDESLRQHLEAAPTSQRSHLTEHVQKLGRAWQP